MFCFAGRLIRDILFSGVGSPSANKVLECALGWEDKRTAGDYPGKARGTIRELQVRKELRGWVCLSIAINILKRKIGLYRSEICRNTAGAIRHESVAEYAERKKTII